MGYSISDATLTAAYVAGQPVSATNPVWAKALLIVGVCAGLIAAVGSVTVKSREFERRLYWVGWLIAAVCFALAALPRGWPGSIGIGFLALFAALLYAYLRTPYLKIGDRVYSVISIEEEPTSQTPPASRDDSYPTALGSLSARSMWWVLVALTCAMSVGVYLVGWSWQLIIGTAFLAVLGAVTGNDDGSHKLPIARGQHAQAFLVSVASILLWLAPPVCYYIAYHLGQRRTSGPGRQLGR
ncbi:MAG TPA: hypothetical protein VGM40_14315 [Mycobacterium sp.]